MSILKMFYSILKRKILTYNSNSLQCIIVLKWQTFYFESHLSISFHLNMTKTLIAIHCPPAARVSNYNFHTCFFCIHVSLVFPIDVYYC